MVGKSYHSKTIKDDEMAISYKKPQEKLEETIKDIEKSLNPDLFLEDLKKEESLYLVLGGKHLKVKLEDIQPFDFKEGMREEYRQKILEKFNHIRSSLQEKITSVNIIVEEIRREEEKKKLELDKKLKNIFEMPNIKLEHLKQGLSVVRGNENVITYIYEGVYWPKFCDRKPLYPNFSRLLKKRVIYYVETVKGKVIQLSTRKRNDLRYLEHYHQAHPDCWGKWKFKHDFNTADDILNLCQQAEAVLENISSDSVASREPRGLPHLSTVMENIMSEKKANNTLNLKTHLENTTSPINANSYWTT